MSRAQARALEALAKTAKTRRLQQGECLNCGARLTSVTGPAAAPDPGDIMVCAYCGHVMEWTSEGLAELSDEAASDIAGNPDVMAAVQLSGMFRADQPKSACRGCGAEQDYGRIRCDRCGKPLVFPR